MNKKLTLFIFSCLLLTSFSVNAEVVRRAAFDFGSGKIKLQVADVDTEKHAIVRSIHDEKSIVLIAEDAAQDPQNYLSEEIQNQAVAITRNLQQKAVELGATDFSGLATEVYRKAPNGQKLVDRYITELNIPVRVIPQVEEGKIGFLALISETNLDPSNVIVWDIGGGSFQITYLNEEKNIQVYGAPFGRSTTKNAIIKFVKGKDLSNPSPNPMTIEEWEDSLAFLNETLPQAPASLIAKLKKPDVQVIGISAHPEKLRTLDHYYKKDVLELLRVRLNKSDKELAVIHNSPSSAISELLLIYSVMDKLGISTVKYIATKSGSTSGILIADEYWYKSLE